MGVPYSRIIGIEHLHFGAIVGSVTIRILRKRIRTDLEHFVNIGNSVFIGILVVVHFNEINIFHVPQVERVVHRPGTGVHVNRHFFGIEIVRPEGYFGLAQGNPVKSLEAEAFNKEGIACSAPILGESNRIKSQKPCTVGGILLEDKVGLARKGSKRGRQHGRCNYAIIHGLPPYFPVTEIFC